MLGGIEAGEDAARAPVSAALAVAAVPEGLPAVLTLTMAFGVERLARRKAIVRRPSAVEALASVTVIATDKTGTLTESRMSVRALDATDPTRALQAMVLANDAEFGTRAGGPLEIALLDYAASQGVDAERLISARPRVSERPFDSTCRFMRVTVEEEGGRRTSYLKGAPEVLIARSTLTDTQKREWEAKMIAHAREGHRLVALAWGAEESEEAVTFLGLVLLRDPPRPEVPDALRRAKAAGIRVLMITRDHPATAEAVGRAIGINTGRVLTGQDLDLLSPQALSKAVREVNIFARVSPEHKLRLVETLKELGEIVAVTGDGVNDAPALKRSDVGIAMGQRGSDVAREVSDVVLIDDNFATIVPAVEEGRNIYENIQRFIRFFFSTDLALILLMTAGLALAFLLGIKDPAGGTFLLPLTAVQLLWINFVADGRPALAMALDRNPNVMARPPRPRSAKLLDHASVRFVMISAAAKGLMGLEIIAAMSRLGYSLEETRTLLFVYESVLQLVFAYPSRRIGLAPLPNVWVHLAVWVGVGLQGLTLRRGAAANAARPGAGRRGRVRCDHAVGDHDLGAGGSLLPMGRWRPAGDVRRDRRGMRRPGAHPRLARKAVRGPPSRHRETAPPRRPSPPGGRRSEESGSTRRTATSPLRATTRSSMRPAPMIATCGGTTTRLAKRPPIMPKFESVMVAPRSSSAGIARASASARMRSRPARRSWASRAATLRSTGTMSPSSVSTAMPISMRLTSLRAPADGIVPGIERRLGRGGGGDRAHQPHGGILAQRPVADVGLVRHAGRHHFRVSGGHALRHGAAHASEGLGWSRLGQASGGALDVGARDRAVHPRRLNRVEIDVELARQRPHRGEDLSRPCVCSPRLARARACRGPLPYATRQRPCPYRPRAPPQIRRGAHRPSPARPWRRTGGRYGRFAARGPRRRPCRFRPIRAAGRQPRDRPP